MMQFITCRRGRNPETFFGKIDVLAFGLSLKKAAGLLHLRFAMTKIAVRNDEDCGSQ